jgi:hypothetical protein
MEEQTKVDEINVPYLLQVAIVFVVGAYLDMRKSRCMQCNASGHRLIDL